MKQAACLIPYSHIINILVKVMASALTFSMVILSYKTIHYALDVYEQNPDAWYQLIQQAMATDFSWTEPAKEYIALYEGLVH